ncbi:MAG: precorrin-2 C(20)-methyltransferase [Desulfobacterales bacterium]|jgi:precorrin-2/cobalt-factor-2 C20-methyltransferase|nr:precorrin-2 C(20)-methyltransferase [Desulfobacterales bacterium]
MTTGTLYGIGIGPGDPDLITVKGAALLSRCRHVVVPKASQSADSVALRIIQKHLHPAAIIHERVFPMVTHQETLQARWGESAACVASLLAQGEDVCFPTLGDTFLYSTYIYLVRSLRTIAPEARIVTIPGVAAFSAAAAATEFAVGEGKQPVTIIPAADDLTDLKHALNRSGTVVIMKVGRRLDAVLDLLEAHNALETGVFAAHVGMPEEHVETDLRKLRGRNAQTGYLSIILTKPGMEDSE